MAKAVIQQRTGGPLMIETDLVLSVKKAPVQGDPQNLVVAQFTEIAFKIPTPAGLFAVVAEALPADVVTAIQQAEDAAHKRTCEMIKAKG